MLVNSSQEEGGVSGRVWLRVKILNSLVFNLRTTVRATRNSLRDAVAPANHWNCAFASFHGLLTSIGLGFLIFR
jgi:hypothetical protein